ncbi:hypothetical protein Belba_0259 [Belliella baltica DSM 15883]|uniref:Uncharacterized protein n=1 Tax=Belliella baltica (strain DSM 15883 / CIP 108006 / LMG 21964 / BA134) TaxID=866536 RepID=I3Z108_BELBD|nr:hypothetical protein [Belliella baltica]AFL82926.1 hypothetical protein Belba_0259 [Belliella baltica DSM 15883]
MKKSNFKVRLMTVLSILSLMLFSHCAMQDADDLNSKLSELQKGELAIEENGGENLRKNAQNQILAEIKQATSKFHKIESAMETGYELGSHCVSHSEWGAMGYHYVNSDEVDGQMNHLIPEALVYEPMQNGNLKLVAVEYIIMADLWEGDGVPMLGEIAFDFVPGNPDGIPFDNYQLHVWVWKDNPNGMYFSFNPKVTCE